LFAVVAEAASSRETIIRNTIKRNLHFSIHCWCNAVTDKTVPAIRKSVSENDIPTLVNLLGDRDLGVVAGASAVLVDFGDAALPALRQAESSGSLAGGQAGSAIIEIQLKKKVPR